MDKTVTIRPAVPADSHAIFKLAEGLCALREQPCRMTPEAIERDGFGPDANFWLLVAEMGGNVVGYALVQEAYESEWAQKGLYISDLYVAEEARGHGVARALMARAAADGRKRGRTFLWWIAYTDNETAKRFYDGLGAIADDVQARAVVFEQFDALADEGTAC